MSRNQVYNMNHRINALFHEIRLGDKLKRIITLVNDLRGNIVNENKLLAGRPGVGFGIGTTTKVRMDGPIRYQIAGQAYESADVGLAKRLRQLITFGNDARAHLVTEARLISGLPGCQEGTGTTTKVRMNAAIRYMLDGQYCYAAVGEGILDGAGNDITENKFGAWRIQIDKAGAITTTASDGGSGTMAYESLELALLALCTQALVANTMVIGYLGIEAAAGGFTIGTDDPKTASGAVTAATYYDVVGDTGLVVAATGAVSATPEELNIGACTVKVDGINLAQVAADTTLPFPLADTVTTLKWGAWLIVSDLAGTAHYVQSVDGDTTASLMAYADYAAAKTAADALIAAMPNHFAVLGVLYIENGVKAPWTAITDDLTDASDVVTSSFEMKSAGDALEVVDAAAMDDITDAAEAVLDGAANDITAAKFGAWRIQIDALGALTTTAADGGSGTMAYESAELALLAIATQAKVASTVVVGYLVIEAAGGGFTIGTDLPRTSDAQVTAATYYDVVGDSGLVVAATGAVSGTAEELNIGAATVKVNGVQLAQVAADLTLPFPLADTVTTLKFGAWLILSDLAGTAHYVQSVDGDTTASLMAYDTYALAKAAADALILNMPERFVVLGVLYIENGVKAPWEATTDDLTDGSDVVTSSFEMRTAGEGIQVVDAAAVDDITGAAEAVLDGAAEDITASKFGAWRFQISKTGALTTTNSNGGTTTMAYESAELALLALATQALVADTVVVGYLVIEATGSGFTIGTDLPKTSDVNVTAATYYDVQGDTGLVVAATGEVSATAEEINVGAATVKINGVQLAQVAADLTLPFPLADTVTTLKWGAWLIVTDLAGTAHYVQSVDGDPTASLMAYDDSATAKAAADALIAAMPNRFVVLGVLYIHNGAKAPWTAITDDITDGSDVTESLFKMRLVGEGIQAVDAAEVEDITGAVGD